MFAYNNTDINEG